MKDFKELAKTSEYFIEKIQNDFFRLAAEYMNKYDLNQTQLAERLGVSKGYVSQILNGDTNFSLKKLIEISLKLEAAPDLHFKDLNVYAKEEDIKLKVTQHFSSGAFTIDTPMKAYTNPTMPWRGTASTSNKSTMTVTATKVAA